MGQGGRSSAVTASGCSETNAHREKGRERERATRSCGAEGAAFGEEDSPTGPTAFRGGGRGAGRSATWPQPLQNDAQSEGDGSRTSRSDPSVAASLKKAGREPARGPWDEIGAFFFPPKFHENS